MPERLRRLDYTFSSCQFISSRHVLINGRRSWIALIFTRALLNSEKKVQSTGAWLGAYVLMPDHFHAFVVIDDQRLDLSAWMRSLKNAFSKVLRVHNVPSPHWQKGPLITFCAVGNPTRRNGIMFVRIRYVPDW